MKAFEMKLPASVEDAVKLLPTAEGDESARLLAGGQDLLTELKEHLVEPDLLVNLKSVPGLDGLTRDATGALQIGCLVTMERLADNDSVRRLWPALCEAAESVGSPQIRTQATVGGNLNQRPRCWYYRSEHARCLKKGGDECFAYYGKNKYNAVLGGGPSYIVHPSDLAPALVAYGATVTLVGPDGTREVALADLFSLPSEGNILRETVLAPGEVLTRVRVPAPARGVRSTYLKFQERGSYDFALGAVALAYRLEGDLVRDVRLVLGAVAPIPWRCVRTERKLEGRPWDDETLRLAAEDSMADAQPLSENGYKVPLTKGLVLRAFQKLGGA